MSDARPHVRLFDWAPSPFCLKVRAILDYKGVPYERVRVLGRAILDVRRRGRIGKVPALEIDGALLVDSTNIALELERRFPTPAILPGEPRQRALCMALEDWADEAVYWQGLYFQWIDPEGAPMVAGAFGRTPIGIAAVTFYRRRIRSQIVGQGTGRKPPAMIAEDLERVLGTIDGLLAPGPFLLGAEPTLADFALMPHLVYLSRPPKSARILARHRLIGDYLERMKQLRARPAKTTA
jgi:glutathione S-transferase